jgi:hypothetical protein
MESTRVLDIIFPIPSEPFFCRRSSSSSHDVIDDYFAGLALFSTSVQQENGVAQPFTKQPQRPREPNICLPLRTLRYGSAGWFSGNNRAGGQEAHYVCGGGLVGTQINYSRMNGRVEDHE